jgi:hypothetical protein
LKLSEIGVGDASHNMTFCAKHLPALARRAVLLREPADFVALFFTGS